MMSDPSSVDRTTFDELTGKLVLLIDESRPWRDATSMNRQLSAKVRNYVRYIRSETFVGEYGQRPQDTIVRLVSTEPPAEDSLEFFQRIGYELQKNGIDFEYQVGEEGIPVLVSPTTATAHPPVVPIPPAPPPPRSAAPTVDAESVEEAMPASEAAHVAEVGETGIDAELAAEIEEALDSLEVGPIESTEAAVVEEPEETRQPEAREVSAADEIAEPLEPATAEEPPTPEEPASVSPSVEPREAAPSFVSQDQIEQQLPGADDWEAEYLNEGPSELEMLIEAPEDVASRFIGLDQPEPVSAASEEELAELPPDAEQTHPPFFPEEEFGRALPEPVEFETLLRSAESEPFEPAIIETSSGKRIRLDVDGSAVAARQAADDSRPSLARAIGAALGAGIVGAIAWAALAIPAAQGASPLALAVALMVGMSVRLRGGGHTNAFRLVGCLGTIFGSALGALLATAALTGWVEGQGLARAFSLFVDPVGLWAAIDTYFDPIDLVSLAIAIYIAYKLSAARPAE